MARRYLSSKLPLATRCLWQRACWVIVELAVHLGYRRSTQSPCALALHPVFIGPLLGSGPFNRVETGQYVSVAPVMELLFQAHTNFFSSTSRRHISHRHVRTDPVQLQLLETIHLTS